MSENDKLREALTKNFEGAITHSVAVGEALTNVAASKPEPPVTADDAFVKLGVMYMKLGLPKLSGTEFVAWCSNWFGPDSDESYIAKAVAELLGNPALAASNPEPQSTMVDKQSTKPEPRLVPAPAGFILSPPNEPEPQAQATVKHSLTVQACPHGMVDTCCEDYEQCGKPGPQGESEGSKASSGRMCSCIECVPDEPEPQSPAAEPDYWHAECDDPDYSAFFPDKADAMARASDHGGTVTPYINHDKFVAAIAQRDAALDACVEALTFDGFTPQDETHLRLQQEAIAKAQEARK